VFPQGPTRRLGGKLWQSWRGNYGSGSRRSASLNSWRSRAFTSQAKDPLDTPTTEPPSPSPSPPGRPASFLSVLKAVASTGRLQRDRVSPSFARRVSIDHIRKTLKDNGAMDKETVGSGVADAIQALKLAHGELGADDVDQVFTNKELTQAYLAERGGPDFEEGHRRVAREELAYWKRKHKTDPSPGTEAGSGVDEQTRVAIQKAFGRLRNPYGGAKLWRDCRRPGASGPVTVEETPRAVHYEGFAVFSLFRLFLRVRAR
jgi:hypothetical protein